MFLRNHVIRGDCKQIELLGFPAAVVRGGPPTHNEAFRLESRRFPVRRAAVTMSHVEPRHPHRYRVSMATPAIRLASLATLIQLVVVPRVAVVGFAPPSPTFHAHPRTPTL